MIYFVYTNFQQRDGAVGHCTARRAYGLCGCQRDSSI